MKEAPHEMQLRNHFADAGCEEMVSFQQNCILSHFQSLLRPEQEQHVRKRKKLKKGLFSVYTILLGAELIEA
jgi:hypothetical protein